MLLIFQEILFFLGHHTSIWLIFGFFLSGGALWRLAALLHQHNDRIKETRLAFLCALANIGFGFSLWLLRILLS